MVLTLIGYRGCGKSSVAAPLAAQLGWDWCDADTVLEEREGRSIREIFAAEGEPYFRTREREIMAELLERERLVIAAGGGAILDPETRARVRQAGPAVWLEASVETLRQRIEGDQSTNERRPQLTSRGTADEIAEVLKIREPLYRACATCIIPVDELSIAEVVAQIMSHIETRSS